MLQTTENNELILVPPEKKSRKKKKVEEPKFVPPFFSEDYFKFLISDNGLGGGREQTTPYLLNKWRNEEYLPLYSLNIKPAFDIPFYEYRHLMSVAPENFDIILPTLRIGRLLKERMPVHGFNYFKKIWNRKNYKLLSYFSDSFVSPVTEADFNTRYKESLNALFKGLIDEKEDVSIRVPINSYRNGFPRLVSKFKWGYDWGWTAIKQQGVSWQDTALYLSNLGFIGRMGTLSTSRQYVSPGLRPLKPLVCVVFKKENYDLVKAYILANEPIPSELLTLWVDKSLEDANDSSQNIKVSYVRQIRNPYKKLGIEVIIRDDWSDTFSRPELQKFRTHQEKVNWIDSNLEKFTIKEKETLRIS